MEKTVEGMKFILMRETATGLMASGLKYLASCEILSKKTFRMMDAMCKKYSISLEDIIVKGLE